MRSFGITCNRNLNRWARCLAWVLLVLLLLSLPGKARAAVTLVSFTATGEAGYILVEWETATEIDNAGFFVQASDQQNGTYSRISDFIFTESLGLTGASYSYMDGSVTPGVIRWYKLESVSNNQLSELTEPVSATANQVDPTSTASPTPTPSPTLTATLTQAATATQDAAYPGPATATDAYPSIPTTAAPYAGIPTTVVPVQAFTPTPGGLAGQSATPTAQPGLVATATPQGQEFAFPESGPQGTIVPLPNISIQYLEDTSGTPDLNVLANSSVFKGAGQSDSATGWSRYGTLGFIVLIWALLGGWFWLTFRKVE